ncbi:putative pectinesterase/pectinesterase inhibitor 51 [Castilleja foliolosa]|uniref:pectinesterase n=1 Tax=Castilleja foliolosa TaxID=1961234 RepID=A0ABD3EKH9_9LAMI
MPPRKATDSPTSPILSSTTNDPKQFPKSKFIFILLVAIFCFVLIFFIISSTSSSSSSHHHHSTKEIIDQVCKATRDPPTCQASLYNSTHIPPDPTVLQAVQSALSASSRNLDSSVGMIQEIMDASADNKNHSEVAKICLEVLGYSEYRMNLSGESLPRGGGGVKDARAWLSAVLAYEYGCLSGLKKVNDTPLVAKTLAFFNSSLIASTGNVLGMIANYDFFGDKTVSWAPPKTERDGFWEPILDSYSGSGPVGVPSGLKANLTVCKAGCDYTTVQEAVKAVPDNGESRFVIWIKSGVYNETVRLLFEKKNVVFLGDGMGKTVITGSLSVGLQGLNTYNTATVGILGDGFMATGLTIENTAGPGAYQAVAFRSDSDLSVIEGCEFIGNQDTLYANSLRQLYKSCRIQGNIDFIFGNSAAFFQDCLLVIAPRQVEPEKGEDNALTAHARIDPSQSTGFVFQNCAVNGTETYMRLYNDKPSVHRNFLGRPWKEYSRTVFINCTLEALISPDGWMPWSGDFALNTLYYGEFGNTGPGSVTSKRVNWSSQIPDEHVIAYTFQNFIQGDRWISASA